MGLEEKYFIKIPNKKNFRQTATFQPYIATNLALDNVDYKFESRFGTEDPVTGDLSQGYLDTFGMKKQTVALNFRYVFQKIYHQFVFDVSFGIGLKYKNVKHSDGDFPADQIDESRHFNVYDIANQEMNGLCSPNNILNHEKVAFVLTSPDFGRDFNNKGASKMAKQIKNLYPNL